MTNSNDWQENPKKCEDRERLVFEENIIISGDFTLPLQRFAESDIYWADIESLVLVQSLVQALSKRKVP